MSSDAHITTNVVAQDSYYSPLTTHYLLLTTQDEAKAAADVRPGVGGTSDLITSCDPDPDYGTDPDPRRGAPHHLITSRDPDPDY